MTPAPIRKAVEDSVIGLFLPPEQRLPLILASPHSGRTYPAHFLKQAQLSGLDLRRSEDSFVDEIFRPSTKLGIPMVRALFPRAYVDPNREPLELDPAMFTDAVPAQANTRSPRVAAGLGTIPRVVAQGQEIYRGRIKIDEALSRIRDHYHPYHAALRHLVDETVRRFGYCVLLDCHSMPSSGTAADAKAGKGSQEVDFVLGDSYGGSCAAEVTETAGGWLRRAGYRVTRNAPYAGGFTTRHYGKPHSGVHALQIEINRALYMNETRLIRRPTLPDLAAQMINLVETVGNIDAEHLRLPLAAE
ncbi:MAG: N-formylglutamate amidohydrolase [Pseudomonadota bacterium]